MVSRCGHIALIGRANVGKSTLLNRLVGEKLSITSTKPQTTRHRLLGIRTVGECQAIYIDTPGLHAKALRTLNRCMNKAALQALKEVDLILFVVDAVRWTQNDEYVLAYLKASQTPVVLVINKIDKLPDPSLSLLLVENLREKIVYQASFIVSAKKGMHLSELSDYLLTCLPEGPHLFPEDDLTDKPMNFLLAEVVREKIFRLTGQELPYASTVIIEEMREIPTGYYVAALIIVERIGQKKIIIGSQGSQLKMIGQVARVDMERLLGKKVFLHLWVKVKENWVDDTQLLARFGYHE